MEPLSVDEFGPGKKIGINVGAGDVAFPWLINVDREPQPGINVVADWKFLPFADSSVDFVNASQILEHLDRIERGRALSETYRVLKVRGMVQISVPDFGRTLERYVMGRKIHALNTIYGVWQHQGWGHKWAYDVHTLQQLLYDSGFVLLALTRDEDVRPSAVLSATAMKPGFAAGIPMPHSVWIRDTRGEE